MYTYKKPVPLGYADAVARVKDELKKEGFGSPHRNRCQANS